MKATLLYRYVAVGTYTIYYMCPPVKLVFQTAVALARPS
jgi:hypothetical protein